MAPPATSPHQHRYRWQDDPAVLSSAEAALDWAHSAEARLASVRLCLECGLLRDIRWEPEGSLLPLGVKAKYQNHAVYVALDGTD